MIEVDAIGKNWRGRGFSCDLWVDPPGRCWEDFVHDQDELVIVLEGTMEFEIAGTVIQPQPGAELFIPAGAVHSARNRGRTMARWLYGYRQG
ncbi:MAG: cupin domain-containing protein [Methylococcaceae bacterium]|nr:cupin domain-containing protein [Methylococcaceae bacterium]